MRVQQEANIRVVAYRLWEEEGRPAGRDLEHWYRAEIIVRSASIAPDRGHRSAPAKPKEKKTAAAEKKPAAKKKASAAKPASKPKASAGARVAAAKA